MKHLKKLSVVLMMTTLFSISFTSCIDTEVSPLVEEIYANQADLIAAQTRLKNAEADLKEAQALNEGVAVEQAQQNLLEAQEKFKVKIEKLRLQLETQNLTLAASYLTKYEDAMSKVAIARSSVIAKEAKLAEKKELLALGEYGTTLYLSSLEADLVALNTEVTTNEETITELEAHLADPTTAEGRTIALEAEIEALTEANTKLAVEIVEKNQEITAKQTELNAIVGNYDERFDMLYYGKVNGSTSDYETQSIIGLRAELATLAANKTSDSTDLVMYTKMYDDYETTMAELEADAKTAKDAVTAKLTAIGTKDGADAAITYNALYEVDANGDDLTLATSLKKYAAPANLQEEYVNAYIDAKIANAAYVKYSNDFDALIATYTAAATAYANAKLSSETKQANLTAANTALTNEQADFQVDFDAYTDAEADFYANPNGSTITDGNGNASNAYAYFDTTQFDLGLIGKGNAATYKRVATWRETSIGSAQYVPASFEAASYNDAELATYISNETTADPLLDANDFYVWNDGATMNFENTTASDDLGDTPSLNGIYAANADTGEIAVFVEVQSDDTVETYQDVFDAATAKLGVDLGTPVYDATTTDAPYVAAAAANDYTYFDGSNFVLTSNAELFNAELAQVKAQFLFDTDAETLADAEEAYLYQKDLYEKGEAEVAVKLQAKKDADKVRDDAEEAVLDAWEEVGDVIADTPDASDTKISGSDLTLREQEYNAAVDLAKFEATTKAEVNDMIIELKADLANNAAQTEVYKADLAVFEADLAELEAEVDGSGSGAGVAELKAELLVLQNEKAALSAESAANTTMINNKQAIITAIDADADITEIEADIQAAKDRLEALPAEIAAKKLAIAKAEYDLDEIEASIAAYETEIAALKAKIEVYLAIAAKYKALMEATLLDS